MKKSFMTRVLATGLSVAMAFSLSTATNLVTAEAAVPTLVDAATGGSGKAVTVDVDAVAKLKINPNVSKTYSVASVKKSSKKIKTAVSKNGTVVYVRGVAATGEKDSAIRVSFKAKKTGKTSKFTFAAKVKVVEKEAPVKALAIDAIAQKKASVVELTFNKELTDVKASQFTVVRADDVVRTVKAATPSTTDKKVVTLEVYESLTDAKDYKVTYKPATGDAVTANFTATAGVAKEIKLNTETVTAGVATEVKYIIADANGIELSTGKIGELPSYVDVSKTFSSAATDYVDGNKVFLKAVDNTLTLKFKYRTYNYKDGEEIGSFESTCKLTAVADTSTVDGFEYAVAASRPDFDKDTLKQWIAKGDTGLKVFFRIKDSNKTEVQNTVGYTVESNDSSVIMVSGNVKDGASLTTVKDGSAMLVLKNAKGETVKTLPIEVKAQRVLSSFDLDRSSVTIATRADIGVTQQTVVATTKDQYGDNFSNVVLTKKCDDPKNTSVQITGKTLTVGTTSSATNAGDYSYTITATGTSKDGSKTSIVKTLGVTVVSTKGGELEYGLVVSSGAVKAIVSSIDTTVKSAHTTGDRIHVSLVEKYNGVVTGKANLSNAAGGVTVSAITIEKLGSGVFATTGVGIKGITGDAFMFTARDDTLKKAYNLMSKGENSGLDINVADNSNTAKGIVKNMAAGTYRITMTVGGKDVSTTFDIVDSQAPVTAKVLKTTYNGSSMSSLIKNKDYIVYYVGGEAQLTASGSSKASNQSIASYVSQKNSLSLAKVNVTVQLTIDGTPVNLYAPGVEVNTVFTTSNGGDWTK